MIIALWGYARSGKDTVARILVESEGFIQLGMSTSVLLDAALALDPLIPIGGHDVSHLSDLVNEIGYEAAKDQYPEVREFLQRLGTEFGNALGYPEVFIEALMRRMTDPHGRYVLSSTRRRVEADIIRKHGGTLVAIDRPGTRPANDHPNEIELRDYDFDFRIMNDSTLEVLRERALMLLV